MVTRAPLPALLALLALSAAAPARAAGPAETPLALGSEIPAAAVKMKSVDGKEVALADVKGAKGTLVVFTCNACPWVKAWQERIARIGNDSVARGVGVVAVNSNDPSVVPEDGFEPMKERAKELALAFPYVVDATQEVAEAFGATRTPEAFLFDAGGRLAYHGTVDDNAREPSAVTETWLADATAAVVAGEPVKTAETKALGCTIKWRP
jgi:peroxiredoxin